ncbi:MAG: TonB-dependent receptor [Candidatus Latescibacterota bacterium]
MFKPLLAIGVAAGLLVIAVGASAQNVTIHGVIYDSATGETLSSASVFVVGTAHGATTDLDGKYIMENVPPGTYDIRVSCLGYSTKTVAGLNLVAGAPFEFNLRLEKLQAGEGGSLSTYAIDDVVVTAEHLMTTDAAVLAARMKAATIGDALSRQQIARSPDAASGDALKRVTGLSVVDDKYVFVRGVTDRYNVALLNGAQVSSTDTDEDKKSFAFDLIPASLMASSVVIKTATPDLPGDFSGGLVEINTLEFPAERVVNVAVGASYTTNTTGKMARVPEGGSKDWLGMDDGSRDLPQGLSGNKLAKALPNNWATSEETARPNGKLGLSIGDHNLFGEQEIGYIGSLTYSAGSETRDFSQAPTRYGSTTPYEKFDGTRYQWGVRWGTIFNFNYKPRGNHKFSIKNTYNRVAKETVRESEGFDETGGQDLIRQDIEWDERYVYVGQVEGDHIFRIADDLNIEWGLNYTTSNATEPDRKRLEYAYVPLDKAYKMQENYRTWTELQEDSRGGRFDVTQELGNLKLKAGYYYLQRERAYDIASYFSELASFIPGQNYPAFELPLLPVDEIFDQNNYGVVDSSAWWSQAGYNGPANGWNFKEESPFTGKYTADSKLNAYYAMTDWRFYLFGEAFRFAGGARFEDWNQKVVTQNSGAAPAPSEIDTTDVLPSANLTYMYNEKTNLRLGYYKSVNRPEFREMSDVLYYNFNEGYFVIGNPGLNRAVIDNYDVRAEWFPSPGDVIAGSVFYKKLENAIEVSLVDSPTRPVRSWFNAPKGVNYGYELELRKSLGFLGGYGKNFSIMSNYTKVESEVEYTETEVTQDGEEEVLVTRPLQGQAPYMVNLGLYYTEPRLQLMLSLLYNRIGRRLDIVADFAEMNVYQEPKDQLDLALTQGIGRFKAKFTIRNLLGEDDVFTSGEEQNINRVWSGVKTYSLSLSFDL